MSKKNNDKLDYKTLTSEEIEKELKGQYTIQAILEF